MAIKENLSDLRRCARALTCSQVTCDRYAAATLVAILAGGDEFADMPSGKVALFQAFHMAWSSAGSEVGEADSILTARAKSHMEGLTPNTREALLLHAIEGFPTAGIASITGVETEEAADFFDIAWREKEISVSG